MRAPGTAVLDVRGLPRSAARRSVGPPEIVLTTPPLGMAGR